jgi:L-cysteine:1D-myo-inositol 2-amino-2-deoxy-alpha-D-glucopyranoside ligase
MRLYNTISRTKEEFAAGPIVSLYVCGVTPYDTTHLGHAFSYASFDVLIRLLHYLGHDVRYTQNVTDIDDDILRRAKQLGVPWDRLGREQTALYQRDMAALNILPPTHFPLATGEIARMIAVIGRLLDGGNAYRVGSQVYFASRTYPRFGSLSRLAREQMEARFEETGDSPDNPEKRDTLDFVLWKGSGPGEPAWPSPWGPGRPGWHIECSAMAMHYLGPSIDIHGGGDDLIFPHHSCEMAQCESSTGVAPFAKIWMHNGAVLLGGVKMSKSLGNLVMVRQLLGRFPADAIRLYLLRHHYRESFTYEERDLERAVRDVDELRARIATIPQDSPADVDGENLPAPVHEARSRFIAALADDLDTPAAAECLVGLSSVPGDAAAATVRDLAGIVGLRLKPE